MKNFILGFITGALAGYILYKNKERIKNKLVEIELKIENLELKENLKQKLSTHIQSIKQTIKKADKEPVENQEEILKVVDKQIKQLEEIIQR